MEITTLLKEKQNLTETRSMESQSYISQFQKGQDSNNFFGDFHSFVAQYECPPTPVPKYYFLNWQPA